MRYMIVATDADSDEFEAGVAGWAIVDTLTKNIVDWDADMRLALGTASECNDHAARIAAQS